jgi:hypothetical protein
MPLSSWEKPLETNKEYGSMRFWLNSYRHARVQLYCFSRKAMPIYGRNGDLVNLDSKRKSVGGTEAYFERISRMDGRFLRCPHQQNSGTKMRVMNWRKKSSNYSPACWGAVGSSSGGQRQRKQRQRAAVLRCCGS